MITKPNFYSPLVSILCVGAALCAVCGCGDSSSRVIRGSASVQDAQGVNNFSIFLDVVSNFNEFDPETARRKALINLNRWIESETVDESWSPDALLKRLPDRFHEMDDIKTLDRRKFTDSDVVFVQESMWFRDLAHWTSQADRNFGFSRLIADAKSKMNAEQQTKFSRETDPLAAALVVLDASLSREDAGQLAVCLRLFDWTIRNIQIDVLLPKRDEIVGPVPGAEGDVNENADGGPMIKQAGPGYNHYPWQILMYGRGDAWERARVFIHLARQVGIDVVMLGHDDTMRTSRATAWVPAAYVNQRLFLFDTALGMPIPGESTPIATLKEVKENPSILRALDFKAGDEEILYPVTEKELGQIVAMIDAAPQYLSYRMHLIEQRLSGESKMVLSYRPAALENDLRGRHGLNVGLWTVAFETLIFRDLVDRMIRRDNRVRMAFFETEGIFAGSNPLANARRKHFTGMLTGDEVEGHVGAQALYMTARQGDGFIGALRSNVDLQRQFGVARGPDEKKSVWEARINQLQVFYRLTKIHAAYWLALTHFEMGNYSISADWLTRAEKIGADKVWRFGVNYNLARAHEAMGSLQVAYDLLIQDDSPQKLGNRILARQIKSRMDAAAAPESSESAGSPASKN